MQHKVTLYTDGAASGNPGPGGFGVVLMSGKHRKELSEGFRHTTNNRMELMAVIAGLEALKTENCLVTVYTDSKYVADAVEKKWVFTWETKGFAGKKNPDLWRRFLKVYRRHQVRFVWIKGHADIPENERCDSLAVAASQKNLLQDDVGYGNG
jgi:ribonuclease HI